MSLRFVLVRDCCIMARRSRIRFLLSRIQLSSQGGIAVGEVSSARIGFTEAARNAPDTVATPLNNESNALRRDDCAKACTPHTDPPLNLKSELLILKTTASSIRTQWAPKGRQGQRIMVPTAWWCMDWHRWRSIRKFDTIWHVHTHIFLSSIISDLDWTEHEREIGSQQRDKHNLLCHINQLLGSTL